LRERERERERDSVRACVCVCRWVGAQVSYVSVRESLLKGKYQYS